MVIATYQLDGADRPLVVRLYRRPCLGVSDGDKHLRKQEDEN